MKIYCTKTIIALMSLAIWSMASSNPISAQVYIITDLGLYFEVEAVNDSGEVVGGSFGGEPHAFLYSGGVMTDLGTLGGGESNGLGINNSGEAVGWALTADGSTHAFLHNGKMMIDLGTLGGDYSVAHDINDSGDVVGHSRSANGDVRAFLYSAGKMTDLSRPGDTSSLAYGINDSGDVVGWYATASGDAHAFLYSGGIRTDLGTLGVRHSYGLAINDFGDVVGYSGSHAFLYSDGTMTDLGTLGGPYSRAWGINNLRQVVGWAHTGSSGPQRAFLYSDEVMIDLNDLLPPDSQWNFLYRATDINNVGQIVGNGNLDGQSHGFLMTPNPLPNRGTIGTRFTISGSDFGRQRGKVYIDTQSCKVSTWTDTVIRGGLDTILEPIELGTYNVTIEPRGAPQIVMEDAFTIEEPHIFFIEPTEGFPGDKVTITGCFFGKKQKFSLVYLGDNNCGIRNWRMNPRTGESEIVFMVPKSLSQGVYDLTVENKLGSDTVVDAFSIE